MINGSINQSTMQWIHYSIIDGFVFVVIAATGVFFQVNIVNNNENRHVFTLSSVIIAAAGVSFRAKIVKDCETYRKSCLYILRYVDFGDFVFWNSEKTNPTTIVCFFAYHCTFLTLSNILQRQFLKGNGSIIRQGINELIKVGPKPSIVAPEPSQTCNFGLQLRYVQFLAPGVRQVSRSSSLSDECCT